MFQALNEEVVNEDFVEIFQWSFCDELLRQINQIPSIKWQSKDILLSYSLLVIPLWVHV